MIKLSVIVTTYAPHHRYLEQALTSIDFNPPLECEIIIVNDSPEKPILSDGTYVVINRNTNESRWGAGTARNMGINAARGEAVVCLDGDDFLLPGALNAMWGAYQQTGEVVYGNLFHTGLNKVWQTGPQYRGGDIKKSPLYVNQSVMPYLMLINKNIHTQIGGYVGQNEAITWEDLIYEADLWAHGIKCHHIDFVTYVYRWSANGRRAIGEDLGVRKTVTDFMYNRYYRFHKGLSKSPFTTIGDKSMPCNSCGGKNPQPVGTVRQQTSTRTLPEPQSYELLYIEYAGTNPTRTYKGPATNITYRFGSNQRIRRRLVVNKNPEWINPNTEIHIEDAKAFYAIQRKGGDDFIAYTEIKAEILENPGKMYATSTPPTEPNGGTSKSEPDDPQGAASEPRPVEEKTVKTPVWEFTIPEMKAFLAKTPVANFQMETWLKEELAAEKPRKKMIAILEEALSGQPITS